MKTKRVSVIALAVLSVFVWLGYQNCAVNKQDDGLVPGGLNCDNPEKPTISFSSNDTISDMTFGQDSPVTMTVNAQTTPDVFLWEIDGPSGLYRDTSRTPELVHTFNKSGSYTIKVTGEYQDCTIIDANRHNITIQNSSCPASQRVDNWTVTVKNIGGSPSSSFETGDAVVVRVTDTNIRESTIYWMLTKPDSSQTRVTAGDGQREFTLPAGLLATTGSYKIRVVGEVDTTNPDCEGTPQSHDSTFTMSAPGSTEFALTSVQITNGTPISGSTYGHTFTRNSGTHSIQMQFANFTMCSRRLDPGTVYDLNGSTNESACQTWSDVLDDVTNGSSCVYQRFAFRFNGDQGAGNYLDIKFFVYCASGSNTCTFGTQPGDYSAATHTCDAGGGGQCHNSAVIVSHTYPDTMTVGEEKSVTITMRNPPHAGGNTHCAWTYDDRYKLKKMDGDDFEKISGDPNRSWVSEGDIVQPGQQYQFSFSIRAPSTIGSYQADWQMFVEGGSVFGERLQHSIVVEQSATEIPLERCVKGAQFVEYVQAPPHKIGQGESATVKIKMRNTGTCTWTRENNFKLGSQNSRGNQFLTSGRMQLPESVRVQPGDEYIFESNISTEADLRPGAYAFAMQMVKDGNPNSGWFGEKTDFAIVNVKGSDSFPNEQGCIHADGTISHIGFIGENPDFMEVLEDEPFHINVTIRNTKPVSSGCKWRRGFVFLGTMNADGSAHDGTPPGNTDTMDWGTNRIWMPFDMEIGPETTASISAVFEPKPMTSYERSRCLSNVENCPERHLSLRLLKDPQGHFGSRKTIVYAPRPSGVDFGKIRVVTHAKCGVRVMAPGVIAPEKEHNDTTDYFDTEGYFCRFKCLNGDFNAECSSSSQ
jgi:hypothetical protein